jgi:hypothetical protein
VVFTAIATIAIIKIPNPISHENTAHARYVRKTGSSHTNKSPITLSKASQNGSFGSPFFQKNTPNKINVIAPPMIANPTDALPKRITPLTRIYKAILPFSSIK